MRKLTEKHSALVIGSLMVREGSLYYNRLWAFTEDGLIGSYNKRHLFSMAGEEAVYAKGKERLFLGWKGWRICPMVCYDLRFPVWSRNKYSSEEEGVMPYDLLIYVANWPQRRVSHWDALLKARAIENQSYVVGVNRVGEDGNQIVYNGHSTITNYVGEELATLPDHQEGLLTACSEKDGLMEYRQKFPAWQDADSFTLL